jgi:tetratricopeptide (TPR) repeat protein
MDQEQILGFYQQVLAPSGQLPRIEVEWGQSMLPTDRRFLQTMRERHGAQEVLVVVRVLRDQPMVDLNQILAQPELDAFQHVAISAVDPMRNESLVRLSELAQFVTEVAQERYEEIADELGLRQEAFHSIQHRLRVLLNPVDILEAVNALIDVQDEAKAIALASPHGHEGAGPDGSRLGATSTFEDQVVWRILSRVFDARPVEEQVLLTAFVLDKQNQGSKLLGARWKSAHARLRAAQLIRNDELAGWATWLKEAKQEDLLWQAVSVHHALRRDEVRWLGQARKWFRDHQESKRGGELHARIFAVFGLINAGKYGRAEEELNTIEPLLSGREVSDEVRGDFWDALGWVKLSMGQAMDGIEALQRAVDLLEKKGQATATRRAATLTMLARGLRDNGRWAEAEPLFREALRLAEEGGATLTHHAITIDDLARGLRDNGHWAEAEPLFREALRLKEEGGATPTSRAITMHELARGLSDNGCWAEAEPFFREALRLKEEGGDTPASRAITMHELARGLLDNGRWADAEPLFREALRLKRDDNAKPVSLAVTMDHLSRGLRDHGCWAEAEPLFHEALRLKEEARDKSKSIRETRDELARGLRANGREAEAKALVEQAAQLV